MHYFKSYYKLSTESYNLFKPNLVSPSESKILASVLWFKFDANLFSFHWHSCIRCFGWQMRAAKENQWCFRFLSMTLTNQLFFWALKKLLNWILKYTSRSLMATITKILAEKQGTKQLHYLQWITGLLISLFYLHRFLLLLLLGEDKWILKAAGSSYSLSYFTLFFCPWTFLKEYLSNMLINCYIVIKINLKVAVLIGTV